MTTPASILITGASSGIGAALAEHYARSGVTLALTGRNMERLRSVARRCEAKGAHCLVQAMDVRDQQSLSDWVAAAHANAPLDLVILNAGLAATRATLEEGERGDEMQAQIQTNFSSTLLIAQFVGRLMRQRGSGHLAFVSSLNGLFPVVEAPTYSATKAGILAYAEGIRDWLEPAGVFVTAIAPGFVQTAIAARYTGPRPFEISATRAAEKIAAGLARKQRRISFPFPLVASIHLGKFVPRALRRTILTAYTARLQPLDPNDLQGPKIDP